MIKELILVRHGKSGWDYDSISDIDRVLKEHGIIDAHKMSEKLFKKNYIPNLIISSSAARAMHTASIFTRTLKLDFSNLIISSDLYLASPNTVMTIIQKTDNKINSLLIVGHNPTFTDLVNQFRKTPIDNMPPASVAGFKFKISTWHEILNKKPTESFFDYPKNS